MKYYFLTLFPNIFYAYFGESLLNKALEKKIIEIDVINIRNYSNNKHNQVDDYPYGGGPGMVMSALPIIEAIKSIPNYKNIPIVYPTPSGKVFEQEASVALSKESAIIFICGHYEGIDQRVIDKYVTHELSIGDYVITGGELPALVICDAISRHISGVLGNSESLLCESFENSLLEYPHYTRPISIEGMSVPEVLTSGNHKAIDKWKKEESLAKTKKIRPDLYLKHLSDLKK